MIYSLGESIELDTGTIELRISGDPIRIEPQVFDVLVYLVTNADRVVTKEELLDNIWGDRFVSESALTSRIKTGRKAVGDDGRAQRLIRTVHGRGYRWVGPADAVKEDQPPQQEIEPPAPSPQKAEPNQGQPERDDDWPLVGRASELAHLAQLFQSDSHGGVLITGTAGSGKTRLADELGRLAECGGVPVARVRGHAEASDIPLACLAHLLPADVATTAGPDGDLSRGLLLQSALRSVTERATDRRLVMLVDDVDRVDDLSLAVISSLAQSESAFVVATQRIDDRATPALAHLLSDGVIEHVELGPLADDVLGVALYRTLDAPLDTTCVETLLSASAGSPGVLRQLVENSLHTGNLRRTDGVWTLSGDLSPPASLVDLVAHRLGGLNDEQRRAAELLALAGNLSLDLAAEIAGEEQLDALDLRGLLAIDDETEGAYVRLAHPLFGEVLRADLRPLQRRRLQAELADAIEAEGSVRSSDRLRIVRWRLANGGEIDTDAMLDSARLAIIQKDNETARKLIDRLKREAPSALVSQLDAEIAFRQGSPTQVERLLSTVDLDELEPTARAQIVRRRTTNMLYGLMDNETPFEVLDGEIETADGEERAMLESQALALGVMVGDLAESRSRLEALLPSSEGYIRLEVLRTLAYATWAMGYADIALEHTAAANELAASLGPSLSRPGLALSEMVEIFAHLHRGDIPSARATADRIGVAVTYGWHPIALARLAIFEARPTAAAELLANPIGIADAVRQSFVAAWMRATLAEIEYLRGNLELAVDLLADVEPYLDDRDRSVDLDMTVSMSTVRAAAGEPDRALTDLFDAAGRAGEQNFHVGSLMALQAAAKIGDAPRAAAEAERLAPVATGFFARCQLDEIKAGAASDPGLMSAVARRYEDAGIFLAAARAYRLAASMEGHRATIVAAGANADRLLAASDGLVEL